MSRDRGAGLRAVGVRYGRRLSAAVACMCGAEMVAPCPMDCGESSYGERVA